MKGKDGKNTQQERVLRLAEKCRTLLRQEKIPVSERIRSIVLNSRAKSRFGKCTLKNGWYEIEVSSILLDADDCTIETVILHELLHTCPGCMNHGTKWKYYAHRMNQKYGYKIARVNGYEQLGLEAPENRESIKYRIVCSQCGQEYLRKRNCRLVEHVDKYRCGKCGGKLEIN